MSSDRQCSIPGSPAQIENDARVEVLLFLGIVFWCWLLISFLQDRIAWLPDEPAALFWNGKTLATASGQTLKDEGVYGNQVPALVTPFLFQPLPINSADAELLATIQGIGPKLASRIVTTRDARGYFTKPQDLLAVPGIGPSRMEQFASQFSFVIPR